MPVFIDNNNYIAWLYIRGIPEYIARARTIYSGIPLIAMQYNINILMLKLLETFLWTCRLSISGKIYLLL